MERLDGVGSIDFDETSAKIEDEMLREQVEAYNKRVKEIEEHRKHQQRQLAAFMGQHQAAMAAAAAAQAAQSAAAVAAAATTSSAASTSSAEMATLDRDSPTKTPPGSPSEKTVTSQKGGEDDSGCSPTSPPTTPVP